jgi:hypothetical protein
MNRCLIFCASLLLTFLTISSACSASPGEWHAPASAARASVGLGGGWLTAMPSRLVSVDIIRL